MPLRRMPDANRVATASLLQTGANISLAGRINAMKGSIPSIVAVVVMSTVLLFIQSEFSDIVAPRLLSGWLGYMAFCLLLLAGTLVASLVPEWRAKSSRAVWARAVQVASVSLCVGIAVSVWILMPPAGDALRFIMVLLCMWFIAMVVILNVDRASMLGAMLVVGSMATFAVTYRIPYAIPLTGFLVMEGVALVLIRRLIWRAGETLESALELMRNERDAKTRFIASASHDLQQPLLAASLYFDDALHSTDQHFRETAAAQARQAFASTRALLQTMLDHLRLEAGAQTARIENVALGPLIGEVVAEAEAVARVAGVRLRCVATSRRVNADPRLVQRVLGNLVTNAIQHSGGEHVLIGILARRGAIQIWVIDDGCGVASGDAERIFADYAQGGEAGPTSHGFGIGLGSARRMTELMNGTLSLDRRWTGGCAFVLDLPQGI